MPARASSLPAPSRPWVARLGLGCALAFAAAVLALHAAGPAPEHMSGFVHTALAPLWIVALAGFAFGAALLGVELRRRLTAHRGRRAGITMLWLAALGALVLAACPVDADPYNRTAAGLIHQDAAPPTFLLSAGAMLALAPAFRSTRGWRRVAGPSFTFGFVAFGLAVAYVSATLAGDPNAGVLQRLLVGCIVFWMLGVAFLLARPARPAPAPVPRPAARATCAR